MKISDAANILGLTGDITPEAVKNAYRKMAAKYHPDRNPNGLEMMKAINGAFDTLKDYTGNVTSEGAEKPNYAEELEAAIIAAQQAGAINLEVCGSWLWFEFDGKPSAEKRQIIKDANCRWAKKKGMWYFRDHSQRSFSRGTRTMDDIRAKYGSSRPASSFRPAIAH